MYPIIRYLGFGYVTTINKFNIILQVLGKPMIIEMPGPLGGWAIIHHVLQLKNSGLAVWGLIRAHGLTV